MTKVEIYEAALRKIARHGLRRKMVKDPPSIREYYDGLCFGQKRNELAELYEMLGQTAMDALEEAEKKDDKQDY